MGKVFTQEPWQSSRPSKVTNMLDKITPTPPIRSSEWWQLQSRPYHMRECPKCGGMTSAGYVAPCDALGECGVIERCLLCAWEKVQMAGRHGRPYR